LLLSSTAPGLEIHHFAVEYASFESGSEAAFAFSSNGYLCRGSPAMRILYDSPPGTDAIAGKPDCFRDGSR
jgi:hypothetical protein